MSFRSRAAVWCAALCLVVGLGAATAGSAQAEDSPNPGLPFLQENPGFPPNPGINLYSWLNPPANGLTGSVKAKQWVQIPLGILAASVDFRTCQAGNASDAWCKDFTNEYAQLNGLAAQAFFSSPQGSPKPYGYSQRIPVRTVAFGAIPVELELQVRQSRDGDDLPEPLRGEWTDGQLDNSDTTILGGGYLKGRVAVVVDKLVVDGVDTRLTGRCESAETDLDLKTDRKVVATSSSYDYDPHKVIYGLSGGGFHGTIDIPAFSGCSTATGDDLSRLLTAAVSGEDNPVGTWVGAPFCNAAQSTVAPGYNAPAQPGVTPTEAGCAQFQFDPDRAPQLWAVPLPWDFPTYAPGEAP